MDNTSGSDKKPALSWSQPATATVTTKPVNTAAKPSTAPVSTSSTSDKSNMSAYIGIFVAGIVIGALLGWGISASRGGVSTIATSTPNGSNSTATQNGNTVNLNGSTIGGNTFTVAASQPAGMNVAVTNISVTEPTWVVIYEEVNGAAGSVIGAELFFPASMNGKTQSNIELVRPTVAGKNYFVGQSVDDGDRSYASKNEKKIIGSDGAPVLSKFTAN